MLNLRLVEVLLGGLAESTHVVFVGDADQLPPIGAGKPFEDLIASGIAPVVRLTQIFRQAARSMITTAAHEVNQGRPPHLEPAEDQDHDFFFIDRATRAGAGHGRRGGRRAGAEALRGRPDPRRPGAGTDVPRGGRDRRPQRAPAGALNPRRQARDRRSFPGRRPPDPDPQLARAGPDERLDRLPPRRRPRRGGDPRRHRRGRLADDPLRRDGDAAPRLRDLGPQGAGLRGPGRDRRLPPLPLADADPAAALHRDHPRPQQLRPDRRPRRARGVAATTAAAATRASPRGACAG